MQGCSDALAPFGSLLDHLVGDCEKPGRHLDAKRPRRLQIDDELELGRLLWVDMIRSRPLTSAG
jgi:hypothetical protein